jgi:hypothetical protein
MKLAAVVRTWNSHPLMSWIRRSKILWIVTLSWVLYAVEPSKWFSTFLYEEVSPHGHYVLETRTTFYSIDRGFVRLYEAKTGRLLKESRVVFLTGNANTYWPRSRRDRGLMVGQSIFIPLAAEAELPAVP